MKWEVDGYYFDGNNIWTILRSSSGETKRVKGMK